MEDTIQGWRSFLRTQIDSWFADTATMEVRTLTRLEPIVLFELCVGSYVNFVKICQLFALKHFFQMTKSQPNDKYYLSSDIIQ